MSTKPKPSGTKPKRKPKPEPFRPTDDQIRRVLLITDVRWLSLDGIQREYLRGIGTRELKRQAQR